MSAKVSAADSSTGAGHGVGGGGGGGGNSAASSTSNGGGNAATSTSAGGGNSMATGGVGPTTTNNATTTSAAATAAALAATTTTTTNGNATPARRLRTRTSTSGNVSGSESAKKSGTASAGGAGGGAQGDAHSATPTSSTSGGGHHQQQQQQHHHHNNNHHNSNHRDDRDDKPSASKKYHNSCPHPPNPVGVGGVGVGAAGFGGGGVAGGRKSQAHTQPHSSSTFNMNKNEEFHFDTPVECPVFRPTTEEFKNPLAYISKIRPIAEKCGIAKILPPESWSPPFAVDVDKLKFTPRVQRLNELEAKTRVKLNFLDQIAKFWELQGSSLKIPMVERKALDLYTLHRIVQEEGGIEQTTKERKWAKVATRMSYPSSKSVGATLKAHYERILHPFEVYTSGKVLGPASAGNNNGGSSGGSGAAAGGGNSTTAADGTVTVKLEDGTDYKVHEIPTRQQIAPPNENNARRSKRFANSKANCGLGTVVAGAAPTNRSGGGCGSSSVHIKSESKEDIKRDLMHSFNASTGSGGGGGKGSAGAGGGGSSSVSSSTQKKAPDPALIDPLMKYICHICNRGDVEESMLLCDGCDDSYHTFCLLPPLTSIPKGEWLCPRCVVEEVSKPTEAFGFEQAEREYTLQQFGQMADQFKMDYFRKPVHLVPTDLVEREFWRIVSSIDEDVTVEYGADLHTMDHGSGFPTKSSLYLLPGDQEYAESSWNLNNLPLLEDSILGHINADISGMNAPWMYVGMCFAAFCWHNEDHWSYSINYLHWGEPKTWYGVPGSCAEQFEETMKQAAPELFASQPDLLHQLVTIMNPNILMNNGVPVFRTDQNAGEFVITFPRAYHAGFNQGYNFAEAVNFAPADWLKMGRECVNHYSMLRRFCVFSHDELVCKMALEPAKLTFGIATACYIDMAEMVDSEKKLRKSLLEWGVTRAERKAFELVPDDERHCQECNTTCFLSAVACECTKAIVCLRHYTVLCSCAPEKHTLLYRYTLDEMPLMLQKLKAKAQSFERWLSRCRDIVDANTPTSVTLAELQELCKEAEVKKFPSSLLIDRLNAAVLEAEKCVTVIQQLGINKVRTRSDNNMEAAQYKLTMEELELFVQEIDNLCCIIEEGASVRELLVLGKQFVERANVMLKRQLEQLEEPELEALSGEGNSLRIELHQMAQLQMRLKQLRWYKRSQGMRQSSAAKLTYNDIKDLLSSAAAELQTNADALIDREIRRLQEIGGSIEAWEKQAAKYFRIHLQQNDLQDIEGFLKTAAVIEAQVPSYVTLRDALRKAREWLRSVEQLQAHDHFPYCHTLEAIVQRGRNIPIQLEELARMQGHLNSAQDWKHNTAQAFLKKNTYYTLLEVLMPRSEPLTIDSNLKKPFVDDFVREMNPAQIVDSFKVAEEKELREMRELRRNNGVKNPLRDDYCLCKSAFAGVMLNCQLCRDWFHDRCVPPPTATTTFGGGFFNGGGRVGQQRLKWLCPSCVRSKRPRLETILPLLVSLQRLPIRLPEDEALRCLAERAMNWQDRARKALTSPDVTAALEAIAVAVQQRKLKRKSGGGAAAITTIVTSTRRSGGRRSSQRHSKDARGGAVLGVDAEDDDEQGVLSGGLLASGVHNNNNNNNNEGDEERGDEEADDDNNNDDDAVDDDDDDDDDEGRLHIVEEGYNSHDETTTLGGGSGGGGAGHAGSLMETTDAEANCLAGGEELALQKLLSDSETENLDELMMEGDVLEVSLDESQELWRLLATLQPSPACSEAHALVEQQLRQQKHHHHHHNNHHHQQQGNSSSVVNSAAEDSNDSLLVQSSPNSNSGGSVSGGGGGGGHNVSGGALGARQPNSAGKKRRSLDPQTGCPVPRKKNAAAATGAGTPPNNNNNSKQQQQGMAASGGKKSTRKSDAAAKQTAAAAAAQALEAEGGGSGGVAEHFTPTKQTNGGAIANSGATGAQQQQPPGSQKKRKRVNNNNNSGSAVSGGAAGPAAAGIGGAATPTGMVTSTGGGGGGATKKHSQRGANHQLAAQEDDEEECRAENCHKPTGREVDWVQCDGGCNEWFHMYCVGLNRSQIKADDDYICIRCSKTVAAFASAAAVGGAAAAAAISTSSAAVTGGTGSGSYNNNSPLNAGGGVAAAATTTAAAVPTVIAAVISAAATTGASGGEATPPPPPHANNNNVNQFIAGGGATPTTATSTTAAATTTGTLTGQQQLQSQAISTSSTVVGGGSGGAAGGGGTAAKGRSQAVR